MSQQDLTTAAPGTGGGHGRRRHSARPLRTVGLALLVALFTLVVFVVALLVTMPAESVARFVRLPPQVESLSGRLWRGRAQLVGGHAVEWALVPGDLLRARLGVDAVMRGPDTLVEGHAQLSPWGGALRDLRGRVGASALLLAPDVEPLQCDSRAIVDVSELAWRQGRATAQGTIRVTGGSCLRLGGDVVPVPAIRVDLSSTPEGAAALVRTDDDAAPLEELGALRILNSRRAILRVEPAGARLIPGVPSSGPTILEYPF